MPELAAAGYHAVAPWLRGYSPTGLAPDGNYQIGAVALDALALADELAGDRDAVLIGHDWGAIAAYPAVAYRPERFSKLVDARGTPPGRARGALPHHARPAQAFLVRVLLPDSARRAHRAG